MTAFLPSLLWKQRVEIHHRNFLQHWLITCMKTIFDSWLPGIEQASFALSISLLYGHY